MLGYILHSYNPVNHYLQQILFVYSGERTELKLTENFLKDPVRCDYLIVEYPLPQENLKKIFEYKILHPSTFILFCPQNVNYESAILEIKISKNCLIASYDGGIKNFIKNFYAGINYQKRENNFAPLAFDYIQVNKKNIFDLYIKLSDEKMIKIHPAEAIISSDFIERYKEKNIETFYVNVADFTERMDLALREHANKIQSLLNKTPDFAKLHLEKQSNVLNQINDLNFSDQILDAAGKNLQEAILQIERDANLLKKIIEINQKQDYYSGHTLLVAYITTAMARQLGKNEKEILNLTVASLIHDSTVSDRSLVKIRDHLGEMAKNIPMKELTLYMQHPLDIATKAKQLSFYDENLEKILVQHHEKQDGNGFPIGTNFTKIHELSAIFIVAEDFVDTIYNKKIDDELLQETLRIFGNKYTKGVFRSSFVALSKIILEQHHT